MNNKLLFVPQWHTTGTISTPDINYKALYPKANDSHWYFVDSDGSEKRIETSLDIRNGITTTNYATSSVFRARLDVSLGLGLTFSGNFAGSTISVFNVTTDMLNSLNTATAGYVLTSNGSSFNWVPTASITNNINGTTDKIAKYNSTTTLGDSLITDDGVKLVVGVTPSFAVGLLNVDGSMYLAGYLYLTDSLNTYIRYNNGIEIQTDEDIIFRDELGYNYLDLKTDNVSSYTFSMLESTLVLGDNGSFSYLLADDIDSVSFGVTSSTMTFSMFSDTPGVLRLKDTSEGSDKVFVSDFDGYGRWQSLRAGSGMTVSGITYSVRLGGTGLTISSNALTFDYSILGSTLTHSGGVINLNNSGVTPAVYGTQGIALQLTIDSYGRVTNVSTYTHSGVTGSTGPVGATGPAGVTGPSVNYGNGIEIIVGTVGLGGTLSQNTSIDGADFNLSFGTVASRLNSFGVESDDSIILRDDDGLNIISLDMSAAGGGSILGASEQISGSGVVFSLGAYGKGYFQATTGTDFFKIELDAESVTKRMLVTDTITSRGLEYGGSYSGNFTTYSLVDKYYVDTQIAGVGSTITAENGLSVVGNTVSLGGTLSQATIIDVSTQSLALISVIDLNIPHFYGLVVENNVSQLGYTNQGSTTSRFESSIDVVSMITSDGSNQFSLSLDQSGNQALFYDSFNSKGLEYGGSYSGNFTTYSLVDKYYVDTQIAGVGSTITAENGLSVVGNTVSLGGTLSQNTFIDGNFSDLTISNLSILTVNNSQGVYLDSFSLSQYLSLDSNASKLVYDIDGQSLTFSTIELTGTKAQFSTETSQGTYSLILDTLVSSAVFIDTLNSKGLEYSGSYSGNFTTYSLVDKFYVDTELSSFLPLSGGTLSGNLEINGTTSNTLTLYSSGTGSTIFRVQGRSGELFSVVDGLTGSLFSVNNISGLPILEVFSDDTILMGDYVAPSLNSTVKVTTVTGSNTIYSLDKSLYTGAFFEYTVTKGTNARAGSIMSVWNGLTASYTETSTTDIGLTTDITFLVSATGSNAILTASASSNNWIIKTIVRSI